MPSCCALVNWQNVNKEHIWIIGGNWLKMAQMCFHFTASYVVQDVCHPFVGADVHLHVQYPLRSENKRDLRCFCGINRAERRVVAIFLRLRCTLPYHF